MTFQQLKETVQRKQGQYDILLRQQTELEERAKALQERRDAIEYLQVAIQQAATNVQQRLVLHIENVVNKVLGTVFADTYTFQLEFKICRGRSEARLVFLKDGHEVDLMDSTGGGVSDVARVALRLACWSLSNAPPVLLLDECAKHLSVDLQPRFAEVLKELCGSLDLQVLFVTHSPAIEEIADKQHRVVMKNHKSYLQ